MGFKAFYESIYTYDLRIRRMLELQRSIVKYKKLVAISKPGSESNIMWKRRLSDAEAVLSGIRME